MISTAQKRRMRKYVPASFLRTLERRREQGALAAEPVQAARVDRLSAVSTEQLEEMLASSAPAGDWALTADAMNSISLSTWAGGVNAGDRRALFWLTHALRPRRMLEVGTHIGASTVFLASSMAAVWRHEATPGLTTVDIIDVNDVVTEPWKESGVDQSPAVLLAELKLGHLVHFVAQSSLEFLRKTDERFDLIFLDGDHSASTVYKEVPAALERLNPGGSILLHDYYPQGKPLWANGAVVYGPYLALERLKAEGMNAEVRPLSPLPWETKLGSKVSSLALLTRDH